MNFQLHDARLVAGESEAQADIAVSRNMLHRVEGLSDTLHRMVSAVRPDGGIVCIAAFRQVSDLDGKGQAQFVNAVRERSGEDNSEPCSPGRTSPWPSSTCRPSTPCAPT